MNFPIRKAILAVLILFLLALVLSCQCPTSVAITPTLIGSTDYPPPAAAEIALNEQHGKPYALSSAMARSTANAESRAEALSSLIIRDANTLLDHKNSAKRVMA